MSPVANKTFMWKMRHAALGPLYTFVFLCSAFHTYTGHMHTLSY